MAATRDERRAFGERVRELRERADLSQRELAVALSEVSGKETTGAAIGGWERAEFAPNKRQIVVFLEEVLGAPGQLAPLLGMVSTTVNFEAEATSSVSARADLDVRADLEVRVARLEARVDQLNQTDDDLINKLGEISDRLVAATANIEAASRPPGDPPGTPTARKPRTTRR